MKRLRGHFKWGDYSEVSQPTQRYTQAKRLSAGGLWHLMGGLNWADPTKSSYQAGKQGAIYDYTSTNFGLGR